MNRRDIELNIIANGRTLVCISAAINLALMLEHSCVVFAVGAFLALLALGAAYVSDTLLMLGYAILPTPTTRFGAPLFAVVCIGLTIASVVLPMVALVVGQ